ncbi:MAG TPA: DUF4124 domain-containing protein [Steroidobacteraceae bacterium]|jgi:hypothetical protein|nr:DUF4124 domain-containing protein [Steroidobacteraceae bacterium]
MKTAFAIFLGTLLASSAAFATTYVRVEKDGTKTYSDRPLPGGQPIDLKPAQTYSAPPSSIGSGGPVTEGADPSPFRYDGCALSPRNDETFHSPESVTLSLISSPSLRPGDRVHILVDGAEVGTGPSVSISNPDRGAHTVNANITDPAGQVLCTATSTFHVQRPTLESPARQRPPRPNPPKPTPH